MYLKDVYIPIIVIISYMIGEIYKVIVRNSESYKKLTPIVVTLFGGILGVLIYITNKEMLGETNNLWMALEIGMTSGITSTNANQIIKKIIEKRGRKENE